MKHLKAITVSGAEYKQLHKGLHICVDGIYKFMKVNCINKETKQELTAIVTQIGVFNYSAAIKKI